MRYDIVPIESCYRGIERSLTTLHLNSYEAKTNFDYVLNQYFDYLKVLEQPCSKKNFCEIMDFYHIFLD